MTTLVVGASGATGRRLVAQLLDRGQRVRIIVRSPQALPESVKHNANLSVIEASVLDLSASEMAQHASGCTAIASCLGHNLTFKGMFGSPRRLVSEATRRLCDAAKTNKSEKPVKFVLMNTTANALLACGASPVMAHAIDEVEEMVSMAGALVLNIGTLTRSWVDAMLRAGRRAKRSI